ncbi:MAG: cytochrome c3 family protein [Acidimicrobiales bacterium]
MSNKLDIFRRLLAVGLMGLFGFLGYSPTNLLAQQDLQDIEIPDGDECASCHIDLEEIPDDFVPYDVHFIKGLSCAGCHGGDASSDDEDIAMSAEAGFAGVPDPRDIPAFCGKCHSDPAFMRTFQPTIRTDQEAQFETSAQGMALADGDTKVATCASCHSAHAIIPASDARAPIYAVNVPETCNTCHGDDEYMAGYGLEKNVFEKFAKSVHGVALLEDGDVGSPACNDCHGSHGALPPEVSSLVQVCGTCHANNQLLFEKSEMGAAFEEDELQACMECHDHHDIEAPTDEMTGIGDESVCTDCHSDDDPGYAAADTIYRQLTALVAITDSAILMKAEVARVGMDDVDIEYLLLDAHQSLIESRTLVHAFDASLAVIRQLYVPASEPSLFTSWRMTNEAGFSGK